MILAGLFEGLFRRGVTLVATSNMAPQELYKDGLQRQRFLPAIELLQSHVEVVHLDGGTDYRLRQLQQAPTYLDSNLPDTDQQMRQRFAALAAGSAGGATTLSVENRHIKAQATGAGMVWFEFKDICEGPRSQNDYIELARLYHTVFVSNVRNSRARMKMPRGASSCSSTNSTTAMSMLYYRPPPRRGRFITASDCR